MTDLLFVYGSLRHGENGMMARRLAKEGEYLGEAAIAGRLYWFDGFCGAADAATKDELVRGDLFRLPADGTLLAALDQYEGLSEASDFHRVKRPYLFGEDVLVESSTLQTWVYMFRGDVAGRHLIEGGDLRAALHNKTIKG